jgi:hypothetical protein
VINTTQVPVEYFFFPVAFGTVLLFLEEIVSEISDLTDESANTLFESTLVDSLQWLRGKIRRV